LLIYDHQSWANTGSLPVNWWPQMYRQLIHEQLALPLSPTSWQEVAARWTQEASLSERRPPSLAASLPQGEPAPTAPPAPIHTRTAESPPAGPQRIPPPAEFKQLPPHVHLALQNLQPLSELLWQPGLHNIPSCLIKLPPASSFRTSSANSACCSRLTPCELTSKRRISLSPTRHRTPRVGHT
jgi:hypothetical protein